MMTRNLSRTCRWLGMVLALHANHNSSLTALETSATPAASETAPTLAIEPAGWPLFQDRLGEVLDMVWMDINVKAGLPILHAAVLMSRDHQLREFLAHGAWVDEPSAGGDRAFVTALRMREYDCMRALSHANASMDDCALENQPLLVLAALRRQTEGMRLLLQRGANPDPRSRYPVAKALIEEQGLKDLRYSLERDRDLTPLMICAGHGDVAGVELLLEFGAKLNTYSKVNKRYPINFASMQGYNYIMQILLGRRPEAESDQRVVVNLSTQRAELLRDGEVVDSTAVSTGRKGYSTPSGTFVITNKHSSWISTIYKVPMPWFMRLSCGSIGLHAGNVPGYPASHGCIRLPYAKAKAFFGQMRVGDVVQIVR